MNENVPGCNNMGDKRTLQVLLQLSIICSGVTEKFNSPKKWLPSRNKLVNSDSPPQNKLVNEDSLE